MEEIQFEYENKGVEINYDLAIDDRQHVLMDAEKIKRVMLNTFENAYKYSKQDPLVLDVFVNEYNENFIKIEIADNGIGVNPDELNKIFDRFYREDKSRKSGNGGSGLGLSIASEIINNHEGKIWAKINEQGGLSILFTLLKAGENFEKITDYRR
jgi:histidine kinase